MLKHCPSISFVLSLKITRLKAKLRICEKKRAAKSTAPEGLGSLRLYGGSHSRYHPVCPTIAYGEHSTSALMSMIPGTTVRHSTKLPGLNNRAENSHQPFRRRERAMTKFRSAKSLQKFAAVHALVPTTSTNNVTFIAAKISSSIAPPTSPSGVNLLPDAERAAAFVEPVVLV